MGSIIPNNDEAGDYFNYEDYWGYDRITVTPEVLRGNPLSNQNFDEHGEINWQPYDIELLNRILKEAYLIDEPPKQWCYSYLYERKGLTIHYAYPSPNDRLFYDCRNRDMPLYVRADSRLIGLATTIMYRYYLSSKSPASEGWYHERMGRYLREYCYYHGGQQMNHSRLFDDNLFEMLLVDFPSIVPSEYDIDDWDYFDNLDNLDNNNDE